VLNQVTEIAKQSLPQPLHLVGHSMGCAVILDSILKGKEIAGGDKIILMAPLVRSSNWKASGFAMKIAGSRLNSVPRKFRKNSSDKDFIDFHKADPLQAETVPTAWVKAHHRWHDQVHSATATNLIPISILQGDDDGTVDWEYNLEFLKKRVPNAEVIMFKDAGHQLANESHITRSLVLKTILKELSEDTNKG